MNVALTWAVILDALSYSSLFFGALGISHIVIVRVTRLRGFQ